MRRLFFIVAAVAAASIGFLFGIEAVRDHDSRPCLQADKTLAQASGTWSGSGQLLVANQFGDSASLVDLSTGAVVHFDTGDAPHDAAVSSDGRWGVVSNFRPARGEDFHGNKLFVIDMKSRTLARTIDTGEHRGLHDVAFRPGFPTRVVVTAQTSRTLIEVDIITGHLVAAIDTQGDRSHLVAVTADGKTAFTTNEGTATISRLDLDARRFVASFPASLNVEGIAVTADGRELWVGETTRGIVRVLDAATGEERASFGQFRTPNRIALTPDGRRVVISDLTCRSIVVADPATRKVISVVRTALDPPVIVGDFSSDSTLAFAALGDDGRVAVLDLERALILAKYKVGWHPDGLGWGPRQ